MIHIRPFQVFTLLEDSPAARIANIMIPTRRGWGSTSTLETLLLIALQRIVKARRVFEFGTFRGANSHNLALNLPDGAELYTLDLAAGVADQHPLDAPLTVARQGMPLDFADSPAAAKIRCLTGDSRNFDFAPFYGAVDLVFVDGGHDLDTLSRDSRNAFSMTGGRPTWCIAWHDYRNPDYPELTEYLDRISENAQLFHVEDTMLVFRLHAPQANQLLAEPRKCD